MNKTILIIIALIVIGGGYFFFQGGGYQTSEENPSLGAPAPGFESVPETEVFTSENSVTANSQLQGNNVTVASIQLAEPGYVAIHEDAEGKPGPVIGNSELLEEGTNVVITLTRESKKGETLYAMLHADDGDGTYEFPGDDVPVKNEGGGAVLSKFSIVERIVEVVPSVKEISMVSGNVFFNPKTLTLAKDQPVKITFSNNGTHTFTIDELGVNVSLRGSSPTVEFTPIQTGSFQYYCAVPGHREGGMFGSLTVE